MKLNSNNDRVMLNIKKDAINIINSCLWNGLPNSRWDNEYASGNWIKLLKTFKKIIESENNNNISILRFFL